MKKKHIDDVQTSTVDEHIKLIIKDVSVLDSKLIDITLNDFPDWYDEKLFKEGQNYYKQNMLIGEISYIIGLIIILTIPTMRQIIKCTKENSTPCAAFKRHLKSQLYIFNMVLCEPNDPHSKLNICRKSPMETRELCQKMVNNIFANYLNNASSDFYHVISTVLDGIGYINISLNKDALLALTYRLHNIEYKASLGWYSWFNMKYRDLILKLYFLPYIGTAVRIYCNLIMKLMYLIATTLPIFAWLSFGRKNTQINLYPTYK